MTTSEQTGGKVFYGWWVVLASGVGLAMHFGPIIVATFGVFLKPLSQEFGWNRTQISLAFSLTTLGITVALLLVGRLVDHFGARRVILPAVLLFGLSVLSLSFLSGHLWHFYALYLLIGVVGSGTTPVPYAKVLSRWFDRRRGLALGLAVAGNALGGTFMPAVAQALITAVGWRHAYVLLGLMAIGVAIPVVGPLLMGAGFDATGSYNLVLATFVIVALTAAGLMTRLGPYRVWEAEAEATEAVAISEGSPLTISL